MFQPFDVGTESIDIDDLTLENGVDVVNMYGHIQFYQDVDSLQKAKHIHTMLSRLIATLEQKQQQGQLVDKVEFVPNQVVGNPFWGED